MIVGVHKLTEDLCQGMRTYATEAPQKGSSATPWIVAAAALGTGYAGYLYLGQPKTVKEAADKAKTEAGAVAAAVPGIGPKKAFTGGNQDFIDLKLVSIDSYNHNTKRFKFALPEDDQVSGLHIACTWRPQHSQLKHCDEGLILA